MYLRYLKVLISTLSTNEIQTIQVVYICLKLYLLLAKSASKQCLKSFCFHHFSDDFGNRAGLLLDNWSWFYQEKGSYSSYVNLSCGAHWWKFWDTASIQQQSMMVDEYIESDKQYIPKSSQVLKR